MKFISFTALVLMSCMGSSSDAGNATGWRGDATGRYLSANPPLSWSKTNNVVWNTKLLHFSNATPLLLKNRLLVCEEPSTLICLDASNGQILWQKTNTYAEVLSPAEIEQAKQVYTNLSANPKTHGVTGFSSPSPVTDGQRVYAVFGNGVAVCYDLDGTRVWGRLVERSTHDWGHSASPVLVGKTMLVHVLKMTALDLATGKTLWATESPAGWGTSVAAKIGDVDVVITPKGDILRISDGVKLARSVSKLDYCAPVLEGNKVYFVENGGKAIRLPAAEIEPVKVETLWQTKMAADRYYASPVLFKDRLYAVHQKGNFSILDAVSGTILSEQKLNLGGTFYPSVTLAGHYLFVSSDTGETVVFDLDDGCKEVARNQLEPFRSSPVFEGARLYIRTLGGVYCIGR
ncbi:MAG: PQQ-binding-like beta-propeller repeat protein [bacterium]